MTVLRLSEAQYIYYQCTWPAGACVSIQTDRKWRACSFLFHPTRAEGK